MANELKAALGQTGLTVTARRILAGVGVVSPDISCPFVAGTLGTYSGDMAGAAGEYTIEFSAGGIARASGPCFWDGTSEVTLETLNSQLAAIATSSGTGPSLVTITVNDGDGNLLTGAKVYLTLNGISYWDTTVAGIALITPTPGDATYSVQIVRDGYRFVPTTLVVSGPTGHTYSMSAVAITPSVSPGVTGWAVTKDASGTTVLPGVTCDYFMTAVPDGDTGSLVGSTPKQAVSDDNGLLQILDHMAGASYRLVNRATSHSVDYVADDATFPINSGIV